MRQEDLDYIRKWVYRVSKAQPALLSLTCAGTTANSIATVKDIVKERNESEGINLKVEVRMGGIHVFLG